MGKTFDWFSSWISGTRSWIVNRRDLSHLSNRCSCSEVIKLFHAQLNWEWGAQWLSGRAFDSSPKGRGFDPHRCHCLVSLSKNINPSLVLVQPRKTRPFITERLLMGGKESNQTNNQLRMKFIMLIYVKMPTIVGILTFIRMINTKFESLKARKVFIFFNI